uniref:Integron gene cassette protein n=1 Tax=Macrostomum lignano TaxID=282301 RepID=A0A1I8FAG4_9PLAT
PEGRGVDRRLLLGSGLDYSSLTPLDKRRCGRVTADSADGASGSLPIRRDFPPHLAAASSSVGPIGLRRFDARLCRLGQLSVLRSMATSSSLCGRNQSSAANELSCLAIAGDLSRIRTPCAGPCQQSGGARPPRQLLGLARL